MKEVELPDGRIAEFPDDMSNDQIAAVLKEQFPPGMSFGDKLIASTGGPFNIGLSKAAGLPVDLVTAGLNLIPGVDIQNPVGGSRQLRGLFADAGMAQPEGVEPPMPIVGRVFEEVGAAAVPFGVAGGVARTARSGGMMSPVLNSFRNTPKANAIAEVSAASGAGLGAGIANHLAPDSPTAEMVGQLVGGILNPTAIATDVTIPLARGVKKTVSPLMPGGAKRAAARQLQGVVQNPDDAVRTLSQPPSGVPGAKLTPAQETGDEGLLQLERALARSSDDIDRNLQDAAGRTVRAVRTAADDLGGSGDVRGVLEDRLQSLADDLDARIGKAQQVAQRKIDSLPPGTPRTQLSRIAREEIETALDAARKQERALWSEVPDSVTTQTRALKETFRGLKSGLRKAEQDDMPEFVSRFLDKDGLLDDVEPLGEVQAFRSKILQEIRKEQALDAPSRRKLALLDDIQKAALDDMGRSAGGDELAAAREYSRQLNERFTQGPIGKLFGHERRGGLSVAPEQTLDRLLTRDGPEGGLNMDALLKAADNPTTRSATEDYVRQRFVSQVTDANGKVRPGAAERFMRSNKELLDRMPGVRGQLKEVRSAQELADRTQSTMLSRKQAIMDKRKSTAALYLDGRPGEEIRKVLNSKNPAKDMQQLVRMARKDNTGEAIKGLKAQFMDEMMRSGEKRATTAMGERALSSQDMNDFLKANAKAVNSLFTKDEISRIRRIADTIKRMEGITRSGRRVDEVLDESPDALMDLVSRIVGANLGAQGAAGSTGAPLVAAGAGARFMRNLTNRLPMERTRDVLAEAVMDRKLMLELLKKVRTPQQKAALQRRLNAWFINLAPDQFDEEGDEQLAQ